MYIMHLLVHSSIHGHLVCFPVLAVVNNAATNMAVQIQGPTFRPSEYMPRSVTAGS